MLGWRANPAGQKSLTRVEKTHGKGKALTVLAHQLARVVSSMFKRAVTFDRATLLRQSEAERARPTPHWTCMGSAWRAHASRLISRRR